MLPLYVVMKVATTVYLHVLCNKLFIKKKKKKLRSLSCNKVGSRKIP